MSKEGIDSIINMALLAVVVIGLLVLMGYNAYQADKLIFSKAEETEQVAK